MRYCDKICHQLTQEAECCDMTELSVKSSLAFRFVRLSMTLEMLVRVLDEVGDRRRRQKRRVRSWRQGSSINDFNIIFGFLTPSLSFPHATCQYYHLLLGQPLPRFFADVICDCPLIPLLRLCTFPPSRSLAVSPLLISSANGDFLQVQNFNPHQENLRLLL